MDQYTQETKTWLDERFSRRDEHGIYFAHQPIYGFRKGHCSPGLMGKYTRTYHMMNALAHIRFGSLLDVGGAEGFVAYTAKQIFGAKVRTSDLSEEACLRAREIFHIDSDPVDIHCLPYADNEFDVTLCSETLEHVVDYERAIDELLRVAAKAAFVTVPCEDKATVERNIETGLPHAHIHAFDLHSFDFLKSRNYDIVSKRIGSRLLLFLTDYIIDPFPRKRRTGMLRHPKSIIDICLLPVMRRVCGKRFVSTMIGLDDLISSHSRHVAMLLVILKDRTCYSPTGTRQVSTRQILDCAVPYHYLNNDRLH